MRVILIFCILFLINCCPKILKIGDHGIKEYVNYKHIEHIDTINPPNVIRYYYWERECHSNR